MKRQGLKEERVLLLEAWRDYENNRYKAAIQEAEKNGLDTDAVSNQHLKIVEEKFPRKIKMRRPVENSLDDEEMEDYYDYVFPDDEKKIGKFSFLLY